MYREQPCEFFPQLAQAVESLVRHAYPVGPEEIGDGTVPGRLHRRSKESAGADLREGGAPSRCAADTSEGHRRNDCRGERRTRPLKVLRARSSTRVW